MGEGAETSLLLCEPNTKCDAAAFRSGSFADGGKENGSGMGNQQLIKVVPTLAVAAIHPDRSHVGDSQ